MDTTVKDWLFLWARTPTSWEEVGKRQILLFVPFPWSTEVGQCKRHKSNRLGGRGLSFSKETRAPGSTAGKSTEYGRQHQGVCQLHIPCTGTVGIPATCLPLSQDCSTNRDTSCYFGSSRCKGLHKARLGERSLTHKVAYRVLLQYSLPKWEQGDPQFPRVYNTFSSWSFCGSLAPGTL